MRPSNRFVAVLWLIGILGLSACGQVRLGKNRCFMCNDSLGIAPDPRKTAEALVQIYAARAYGWRGIFAVHTWIALKPRNAKRYTVLQVLDWWPYPEAHPLRVSRVLRPDRRWHGAAPEIVYALRGDSAEAAIPKIREAANGYPHNYQVWPGPNSNTFTAYVIRRVSELKAELPPTAIGKDFLLNGGLAAISPSGTGFQLSLKGLLGLTIGIEEGIEVNLIGLTFGVDFNPPALKLPVLGRVGMSQRGVEGGQDARPALFRKPLLPPTGRPDILPGLERQFRSEM